MNRKSKSIAFVVHSHYPKDPRVRRQARTLIDDNWRVDVYCLRKQGEKRFEVCDEVNVHRFPVDRHRGAPLIVYLVEYLSFLVLVSLALGYRHLRRRYDVVQVANPPDFLIVSGLIPRLLGARIVFDVHDNSVELADSRFGLTSHSIVGRVIAFAECFATSCANLVLSADAGQMERLIERGLPEAKAHVIWNGPDTTIFRERSGEATNGEFIALYHGTVIRPYGCDLLLQAAARLRQRVPALRIDVLGEGEFLESLRSLAQELALEDLVRFHGHCTVDTVIDKLAQSSVSVIPTRRDRFTDLSVPTRLFESACVGVPCVVTRTETVQRYFPEDALAYFDSGRVDQLADQLERLAANPDVRASLRRRAAECVRPLTWTVQGQKYSRLIDELQK